ncbi:conserved hypothetical protein [Kamptonema sp. PCC 6506]|nr:MULTISPECIES: DUF2605 family protein [Kamptonema]CBN58715.1 conserved hypothetical protein [Kamptonema sp. PCC 6506]
MVNPNLPETQLLKALLPQLLEDFWSWFERSIDLLKTEDILFFGSQEQCDLLARVRQAQQEVSHAQVLFQAIEGEVEVKRLCSYLGINC